MNCKGRRRHTTPSGTHEGTSPKCPIAPGSDPRFAAEGSAATSRQGPSTREPSTEDHKEETARQASTDSEARLWRTLRSSPLRIAFRQQALLLGFIVDFTARRSPRHRGRPRLSRSPRERCARRHRKQAVVSSCGPNALCALSQPPCSRCGVHLSDEPKLSLSSTSAEPTDPSAAHAGSGRCSTHRSWIIRG